MSDKSRNLAINVMLFVLVLIAASIFIKYATAFLVSLGLAKAAAVSISKLTVAVLMFVGYTALKEKGAEQQHEHGVQHRCLPRYAA